MVKVFVICGHGAGDPGACAAGQSEAALVRKLAARMKALGGSEVQIADMSRNWYADNGIGRGQCPKGVPVIELHMDSAGAGARGAHVIIKAGFKPDAVDNALADRVCAILPGRSQRIVGRSDLANPNRAARLGINYRLLEVGFITDATDLGIFNGRMDEIARAILGAFGVQAVSAPVPAPHPAPKPTVRQIAVDGIWGADTTLRLQEHFGCPFRDGKVSRQNPQHKWRLKGCGTGWEFSAPYGKAPGSQTVSAVQRACGVAADGFIGPDTINALIRHFKAESGAKVEDGKLDADSPTIKAMQRTLNEDRF